MRRLITHAVVALSLLVVPFGCGSSGSGGSSEELSLVGTWEGAFVFPDGDAGVLELTFGQAGDAEAGGSGSYGDPASPRAVFVSASRDADDVREIALYWSLDEPRQPGLLITFEFLGRFRGPDTLVGSFAATYTPDNRADLVLRRVAG